MHPRTSRRWTALAVIGLTACHSATEPVTVPVPGLRFSGAANVTDTIGATIPQALVVDVHDSSGAVVPVGTVVRFTAIGIPYQRVEALVGSLTSPSFSTFATATTDQAGQTAILIQLGNIAGTARVIVNVPALGLQDTARFTVTPGNASRLLISPFDTALYVGKSFTLRGGIVDRWGNPRSEPVTWISSGPGVTVTSAGLVTGGALGRYAVTAAGLGGSDSVGVSVVPPGRLVALARVSGLTISAFDVDGSNQTTLTTVLDGGIGPHPAWIPGTNTVVYTTVVGPYQTLYTVGADGVVKPFFATTPPNVTHEADPTPSADGQWLYFTAYDTRCSSTAYCVSRAKIDGSAPELLVTTPSTRPAPSPDGSKVAYVESGQIKVLDVATRTTSSWSVSGDRPAWSPDGTQIAYLNPSGVLSFVAPDGTTTRALSPAVYSTSPPAWSADGKWVLGESNGIPALIDAVTGTILPLRYATGKGVTGLK